MATKAFGIRGDLELNSAGFEAGARRSRQSMKSLTADIQRDVTGIRGSLDSATAALGGFAKGLAAGAIGAAASLGVSRMIQEVKEAETAQLRLQGALKATGFSAGLSAEQIIGFADGIERSTLQTSEAVQGAATVLATFRSISGETFKQTLGLAVDLSEVMQTDLKSSVLQLGKALEDPLKGLSALSRSGVSFKRMVFKR